MNKLVYLFELDSVRTTLEEIKHGQEALFDEIVKNGNFIACTFNQIVDSPAFLAILNDEKKFQDILQLINFGVIRVSRYAEIRTPSQYAQKALDKCICDTNNFIFSSLPITRSETDLLNKMNQALKNTDLSILIDEIEASTDNKRIEKLTILMRFVKLVLTFSMEGLTINQPKDKGKSLQEFIDMILKMKSKSLKEIDELNQFLLDYGNDFISAQDTLKQVMESLEKNNMDQRNRSNWFKIIDEMSIDDNVKRMPKAIVDLCYNYAVEESILGVYKHYKDCEASFKADFFTRLKGYISSKHDFSKSDRDEYINYKGQLPDWDVAVRLRNQGGNPLILGDNQSSYYEDNFIEEQSKWAKSIIQKIGFRFLSIFVGILIFLFAEIVIDWVKNIWSILQSFDDKTFLQLLNTFLRSFDLKIITQSISGFLQSLDFPKIGTTIMNIIIFGIISAQVSKKYKIPDLLESFKGIWLNIYDAWRIWKNKENEAYHRL